jgi:hypothetical protein
MRDSCAIRDSRRYDARPMPDQTEVDRLNAEIRRLRDEGNGQIDARLQRIEELLSALVQRLVESGQVDPDNPPAPPPRRWWSRFWQ